MQIVGIRIEGLRTAPNFTDDGWDRTVELPSGPEGIGVADALTLFAGALSSKRVRTAVERVGLCAASDVEVWEESGLPGQVSWPNPAPIRTLLADGKQQITIAQHPG